MATTTETATTHDAHIDPFRRVACGTLRSCRNRGRSGASAGKRDDLYRVDDDAPGDKWYSLTMYPYPSGVLHIGHWYAFAVPDVFARFQRMRGYNVLFPMGFDAFGLPAENAAIRHNIHPAIWTFENIAAHARSSTARWAR